MFGSVRRIFQGCCIDLKFLGGIIAMHIWGRKHASGKGETYLLIKKRKEGDSFQKNDCCVFVFFTTPEGSFQTLLHLAHFPPQLFSAFFLKKLNVLRFMFLLLILHFTWRTFCSEKCWCFCSARAYKYILCSPSLGGWFSFFCSWLELTWFYHLSQLQLPLLGQLFPTLSF